MAIIKYRLADSEQIKQISSKFKLVISKDKIQKETTDTQIIKIEKDISFILQEDINIGNSFDI